MSGARGNIRKIFDISPTAVTTTGVYDGSTGATSFSSGLTSGIWLTSISQSVNDNGRVGISVALETFDLRLRITPAATVAGYQTFRILVVADNECDGAIPALGDVLGDANGGGTTVATGIVMQFLQPAYFGRFHVIHDKFYSIYNSSTANSFTENQRGNDYIVNLHEDMKSHRLMWDTSDSSAIANARKGHIFMFILFENNVTAAGGIPAITSANPPSIAYAARFRFRDE